MNFRRSSDVTHTETKVCQHRQFSRCLLWKEFSQISQIIVDVRRLHEACLINSSSKRTTDVRKSTRKVHTLMQLQIYRLSFNFYRICVYQTVINHEQAAFSEISCCMKKCNKQRFKSRVRLHFRRRENLDEGTIFSSNSSKIEFAFTSGDNSKNEL